MTYQDLMELTTQAAGGESDATDREIFAFMASPEGVQDCEPSLEYCVANHLI